MHDQWNNLILGYAPDIDPEALLAHPSNAWIHPALQQEHMLTLLSNVGWWDAVKVDAETWQVVDGHLRVLLALRHKQKTIPVLFVKMDEGQQGIALAWHNQIAREAFIDVPQLDTLLQDVRKTGALDQLPDMLALVDQLAAQYDLLPAPAPPPPEPAFAPRSQPVEPPYASGADPEAPIERSMASLPVETRQSLTQLAGHRTAAPRREMSRPMQHYRERGLLTHPVLDYGAGQDRHDFPRFDPAYTPDYSVFRQEWRTITVTYVLNIILLEHNRVELLAAVRGLLMAGGQVFVAVWEPGSPEAQAHQGFQTTWDENRWERLFGLVFPRVNRLTVEGFWAWQLRNG